MSGPRAGVRISAVGEEDLADLLPLVRGYADFYGVSPADDDLLALSRALIADPRDDVLRAHVVIPVNWPPVMLSTWPWT